MTIYERFEEIKNETELTLDNAREAYYKAEATLVELVGDYVVGAEVTCVHGSGHITKYSGTALDNIIVDIEFAEFTKRYSLNHILTISKFIQFADTFEIGVIWTDAMVVHKELSDKFIELERTARQLEIEAAKKAEAEKKAEEKYQKAKAKAIKDFDDQTKVVTPRSTTDEFYYALGWLASHVGAMTAVLPDYLGSAFEKHFGIEAPKTLVDSRAKTSGGYAKQWSWEFKCTIKKLKETTVPACIQSVTTDFSKGIHNTAFLWDLVDNYGFQFGKTQDVEKIKDNVPAEYISFFEAGLAA